MSPVSTTAGTSCAEYLGGIDIVSDEEIGSGGSLVPAGNQVIVAKAKAETAKWEAIMKIADVTEAAGHFIGKV